MAPPGPHCLWKREKDTQTHLPQEDTTDFELELTVRFGTAGAKPKKEKKKDMY